MYDNIRHIIEFLQTLTPRRPERIQDYVFYLIQIVAWVEALTAIGTSYAKRMIPLRTMAMLNNVLGILVGLGQASLATFVEHLVNLPLNAVRLREMRRLVTSVREAAVTDLNVEWLKPFMHPRSMKTGATLFSKGDPANEAFMLIEGRVEFPEISAAVEPGALFGEMALFTATGRRTASAVCSSDVRLLVITYEQLEQLYFQNPEFGLYLVRLIVQRFEMNHARKDGVAVPSLD